MSDDDDPFVREARVMYEILRDGFHNAPDARARITEHVDHELLAARHRAKLEKKGAIGRVVIAAIEAGDTSALSQEERLVMSNAFSRVMTQAVLDAQ